MEKQRAYPGYETAAFDAIERIARLLDLAIDPDAPEPAIIASVERVVTQAMLQGHLANTERHADRNQE